MQLNHYKRVWYVTQKTQKNNKYPDELKASMQYIGFNNTYCISGNIGDIFNLAVWWSGSKLLNFYHQIGIDLLTMLCPCCATAKFNFH